MKIANSLLFLFLISIFIFSSCKEKNTDVRENARQSLNVPENVTPVTPSFNQTTSGLVQHYICPNNCEGSGGPAQGSCPVCGAQYLHNQAWHDQQQGAQASQQPFQQQPDELPGQNALGVWHYICNAGCPGGSGAMGNCTTCGAALVHNDAYHN